MLLHKSKLSAYTVYLIFSGVTSLSGSLISTVNMVYQVETARLNPLQLVLVGTVLEFVAFVCQVPTGVLADIYSRRLAVILGTLLFGMAFVLEGSFPRFDVILVSQILFGIGATLSDGAEQAWITDEVGEMRIGHVFLRSTQVGLLAGLLGAIISVGLASIRINIPIVIGGALSIGVAGFLLLFMPENNFHPISKAERRTWRDMGNTFRSGLHVVRGRPILITILLIALFYGLYSEGIVCLLVFALAGNFFLAVAAVLLFKVFRTVNDPVYTTWLTQNIEAKVRATVISMRGQVDAFGQIVGGPPVGYIGTTFSIQTALLASCALLSPVLFLYAYAARKAREKLPQPS